MNTPTEGLTPEAKEALSAAVDLVKRTGARSFEVGWVRDGVPSEQAGWYATASYRGTRVIVEEQRGPVEAVDALARRLLGGGTCAHCAGPVTFDEARAGEPVRASRQRLRQLEREAAISGAVDTKAVLERAAAGTARCWWRREGARWVRGCEEEPS